ncbi:MAG: hypothetical protein WEB87_01540, partial [Bacteriovoracaceae bacterium]
NNLPFRVHCPASKSYTNRALIAGALQEKPVRIFNPSNCDDSNLLINGLKELGVRILKKGGALTVSGCLKEAQNSPLRPVYLGEGGTTIRFFTVMAATLSFPVKIEVHPRFLRRPFQELRGYLLKAGASLEINKNIITVQGPLKRGVALEIDCSESTQFASAFELISESVGASVKAVNVRASADYLKMTAHVLKKVKEDGDFYAPPDFSSLSYFTVYACLTQELLVENIKALDPLQADSKVLEIIKELGGDWEIGEQGLTVFPAKNFNSVEIDGSQCLDAIPSLLFLLAYSKVPQKIKNIKNLRRKESDRLDEMTKMLKAFNISFEYDQEHDVISVKGPLPAGGPPKRLVTAFDHRMVMTGTLFLKINGGGEISPAEAVEKSFPEFFEVFK